MILSIDQTVYIDIYYKMNSTVVRPAIAGITVAAEWALTGHFPVVRAVMSRLHDATDSKVYAELDQS